MLPSRGLWGTQGQTVSSILREALALNLACPVSRFCGYKNLN